MFLEYDHTQTDGQFVKNKLKIILRIFMCLFIWDIILLGHSKDIPRGTCTGNSIIVPRQCKEYMDCVVTQYGSKSVFTKFPCFSLPPHPSFS